MTPAADPYAALRRKLRRMEPLTDIDALRARADVEFLEVADASGQVRGLAVVRKGAGRLNLRLYYADDPAVAAALMNRLNAWVAAHKITRQFADAA